MNREANKIVYDDNSYSRTVTLVRPIDNRQLELPILLVSETTITNQINTGIVMIELLVEETETRDIEKYTSDGNSFMIVNFSHDNPMGESIELLETYVIHNIGIVTTETDACTYLIEACSVGQLTLNAPIHYSNYGNPLEIPKLISNVFMAGGLPVTNVPTLNKSSKMEFITNVNDSMRTSILYLMNCAMGADTMLFMYFNRVEGVYEVMDWNEIYVNGVIPDFNYVQIPTKESNVDKSVTVFDQRPTNVVGGGNLVELMTPITTFTYDTLARSLTNATFTTSDIRNILPTPLDKVNLVEEHIIKDRPSNMNLKHGYEVLFDNNQNIGNRMGYMTLNVDILSLSMQGYIGRDVGQLISITMSNKSKSFTNYSGTWVITEIENIMFGNTFKQNIVVARTKKLQNVVVSTGTAEG